MTINPTVAKIKQFKCSVQRRKANKLDLYLKIKQHHAIIVDKDKMSIITKIIL